MCTVSNTYIWLMARFMGLNWCDRIKHLISNRLYSKMITIKIMNQVDSLLILGYTHFFINKTIFQNGMVKLKMWGF